MTLFIRNRDMPTLSLKGSVCVPLFLFLFVSLQLIATPLFAQDKNRVEEMFHLGKIIISSEPLPDKVYDAQKNKFLVNILFLEKGTTKVITSGLGTGFIADKPGVILTARHLLVDNMREMDKIKAEMIKTNPRFDYDYVFRGTIITPTAWVNFPLSMVAVGENGTMKDIMVLKTDVQTIQQAQEIGNIINPNPFHLLLHTFEFADANVGERVYITGFAPVVAEFPDKNKSIMNAYLDMINFTFSAEVLAKIEDMPINRAGIKLMYRLKDSAEPGFSGGLTLNARGQVIGITVAVTTSKNFVYAISSKDIKDFLKDNKIR